MLLRLVFQGVKDLALNPWAQIATFSAVTLVAFLSGLFLMMLATFSHQLGTVRGETSFQVYWHPGTDIDEIRAQWDGFPHLPGFNGMQTYTPEEALDELGTRLGRHAGALGEGFPFLAENSPLPATALLSFALPSGDIERLAAETADVLKALPGVSRVAATPLRDELGAAWRNISRYVMWPSVAFLNLVLGLVVANTVRLSLMARAHEIEILQLAGAFNWYIRTPLIVGATLLGLSGGLVALALLKVVHLQIEHVLNFPPLLMQVQLPSLSASISLVLIPALTAAVAGFLAVRGQ